MNRIVQFLKSSFRLSSRNGTVRYMFPAIISFVAMMGAAVITSKDVSYVRLETSDTTVEAGNQFSIDVFAYAHVPVNAVDVTLQFDSEAVEVLGVDRGQSVLTIWTRDPVIENGKVILQGGTYRKGFLKEHRIATINVRAKETGQSTFEATNVMLLAGDGAGSPVSVADSNNSVVNLYIYDENTSPDSIGVFCSQSVYLR